MKHLRKILGLLALAGIGLVSFSFVSKPGGDKFEIHINNKLVLEQYVTMRSPVKHLALQSSNYNETIDVRYNHCGHVGTERAVTLKDDKHKTLKVWQFANSKNGSYSMTWKVKEIMDFQKNKDRVSFKLYYSSSELPEGKLLANVSVGNSAYVSR